MKPRAGGRRGRAPTDLHRFVDALRDCLGLAPLCGEHNVRSDVERFAQTYQERVR